ncbi:MAG: nucleotide pyrophosphohydrolase [Gammaproteobacteria bacterium]|nr:MAG: nucleotide pyrophosphohydrolase [Gammaproteobacteria bacterium]
MVKPYSSDRYDGVRPDIEVLSRRLKEFARQRNWEQYHTPKNLVMALSVEAAELLEHFQWRSPEASSMLDSATREEVAMEMADVFIYLLRLAECLDIDLKAATERKIAINEQRFPPGQQSDNS